MLVSVCDPPNIINILNIIIIIHFHKLIIMSINIIHINIIFNLSDSLLQVQLMLITDVYPSLTITSPVHSISPSSFSWVSKIKVYTSHLSLWSVPCGLCATLMHHNKPQQMTTNPNAPLRTPSDLNTPQRTPINTIGGLGQLGTLHY
ncbi:hypothetical protein GN956_G12480 [Arapaima gigas]